MSLASNQYQSSMGAIVDCYQWAGGWVREWKNHANFAEQLIDAAIMSMLLWQKNLTVSSYAKKTDIRSSDMGLWH